MITSRVALLSLLEQPVPRLTGGDEACGGQAHPSRFS